ncbi:DUF559 domain-containing protein [Cryomorpha ignava]|uniref:DUF559 domain-containing protein n=1 Tax=Cryomorpha ignava TaxID=101383 RepID=A0A7K3WTA1_9FLAO|nr:DUF559 domain-containing protein [Cryomorpha ignava]
MCVGFYCHEKRLSIDLDGKYHGEQNQKDKDKERTAYLNGVGIHEIRFSNHQVVNDFKEVVLIIKAEL